MKNNYSLLSTLLFFFIFSLKSYSQTATYDCKFADAQSDFSDFTGDGFGSWNFFTNASNGGFFTSSSTGNGDGDSNGDGDIDTTGKAWGIYANSGDFASATRDFDTPMVPGDTFKIDMDNGWIDNGSTVGFGLQNSSGENLIEFFYIGKLNPTPDEDQYTLKSLDEPGDAGNTGIGFTDEGLSITFTLASSTTVQVDITQLSDGTMTTYNRTLFNPGGTQEISKIRMFNANAGFDGERNAYFNSIEHCIAQDLDGDGSNSYFDCDDNDATVFLGAPELCDGKDNDCDGFTDEGLSQDLDGDGHYAPGSCQAPANDCDDTDATVFPGAPELCDGIDNNCDGVVDEGLTFDADGDGFYAPGSCLGPATDCDDNDATVFPGASELCDGIDNDCDGFVDEGLSQDLDGDGHYAPGSCQAPANDCDDTNPDVYPGAPELCDGIDNDCDGQVDENLSFDLDGDGHYTPGSCLGPADDCDDSDPTVYLGAPELCDGKDNDCDGFTDEGLSQDLDGDGHYAPGSCQAPANDCDDTDATVFPGAPELCDGIDNNCDGVVDEGFDVDNDGFTSCGGDCDDNDANNFPGNVEVCDGADNNCDGVVDEGFDVDNDGFTSCGGDCDDNDANNFPGNVEVCDGADNNCDGVVDEGFDVDNDGFTSCGGDCDDNDASVYPGATELCDGLDNDCDGVVPFDESNTPDITPLILPTDPMDISQQVDGSAQVVVDATIVSASWDWGDSSTSPGALPGGNSVTGSHTYSTPGVYAVKLTVTNSCGLEDDELFQYVVIYDPSGGFVTGGGWIDSPEGAYVTDASLIGKANFGFVSKYKKGQSVPDGNTEFQFQAGDLNFKSTSYDWLIIAGTKAIFKGDGKINGVLGYKFLLSAKDESKNGGDDTFRIKIWDAISEVVVYDNQLGAGDDAEAITVIGGGSIIVHKPKGNNNARGAVDDEPLVEKLTLGTEIVSWPNPSKNVFNLKLYTDSNVKVGIYVYDMSGRLVHQSLGFSDKTYQFGSSFDSGIYIVNVTVGDKKQSLKLVKY